VESDNLARSRIHGNPPPLPVLRLAHKAQNCLFLRGCSRWANLLVSAMWSALSSSY
jgi:hypothetical protein